MGGENEVTSYKTVGSYTKRLKLGLVRLNGKDNKLLLGNREGGIPVEGYRHSPLVSTSRLKGVLGTEPLVS